MFGCGKFSEIELLKYLEGSKENLDVIEKHLKECPLCMKEITELNRVSAIMESGRAEPLRKKAFVTIFAKNQDFEWVLPSAGTGRIELLPQTRTISGRRIKKAVYTIDEIPANLEVVPVQEDTFWVLLRSPELSSSEAILRKKGSLKPIYSISPEGPEVIFKGIGPGEYEVYFREYVIRFNIKVEN